MDDLKITVYGSGCPSCKKLYETIKELVMREQINAEIHYEDDLNKIIARGLMQMPGLEVNGVMKSVGKIPKYNELIAMLKG